MMDNCRICCETTQGTKAKNLFESRQSILLHHIEQLTGEWLTEETNTPTHICICCEQDLKVSVALRERCIKTQRKLREENRCTLPTSDTFDDTNIEGNLTDECSETEQCDEPHDDPILNSDEKEQVNDVNDSGHNEEISVEDDFEEEDDFNKKSVRKGDLIEGDSQCTEDENISIKDHCQLDVQRAVKNIETSPSKRQGISPNRTSPELSAQLPTPEKRTKIHRWRVLAKEQEKKRERKRRHCVCDQCGRHFSDLGNLKLHLIRHSGIKKYECEVCKAKFYSSNLLKRHSLKHTSTPPTFACKLCGKTFIYNNYRLRHEREHFKERRFSCVYCDKTFYNLTAKKDHELIHIGFREFHCELCDQHFLRKTHLRAHYRSKTHKKNEQQKK